MVFPPYRKGRFGLHFALTFIFAFLTWIIFSGKMDLFHLAMGVVSCALVAHYSGDFFWGGSKAPGFKLSRVPGVVGYTFWMVFQIGLSAFHVMALALLPKGPDEISPHIVTFNTKLTTDFGRFVLGNSITLTPGTVTLKVEGDKYTVHAISDKAATGLPGEMERRIAEVFES